MIAPSYHGVLLVSIFDLFGVLTPSICSESGHINWIKRRGAAKMVSELLAYQETLFAFETLPLLQEVLLNPASLDNEKM